MKENISLLHYIKKAFLFEFDLRNRGCYENDRYPMSVLDKIKYIVSTCLSKNDLQELVRFYSSYSYGVYILNSVFPKFDNP